MSRSTFSSGLPHKTIVGLLDGAVSESADRIRARPRDRVEHHVASLNLAPSGARRAHYDSERPRLRQRGSAGSEPRGCCTAITARRAGARSRRRSSARQAPRPRRVAPSSATVSRSAPASLAPATIRELLAIVPARRGPARARSCSRASAPARFAASRRSSSTSRSTSRPGLPHTTTVGLPDGAVREAADRIRAALRNSGFELPAAARHREPRAGRRPQGRAALDLPIALGMLAAAASRRCPT